MKSCKLKILKGRIIFYFQCLIQASANPNQELLHNGFEENRYKSLEWTELPRVISLYKWFRCSLWLKT